MLDRHNFEYFMGKNQFVWFIGVVEDNNDPLTLGRVKVRCFGFHPEDRTKVPTVDLPWAIVIQPTASVSGVGTSPNYLVKESWVLGFFADGETAQYPYVIGSIPGIHRPSEPGDYIGNSGSGYLNEDSIYSGEATEGPYSVPGPINPGEGSVIKDDGSYLTKQNISNWPLKIYKWTPANGDTGLACKDGKSSLRIHYASALALEQLAQQFGKTPGIISGYRTPAYNAKVGGAKNSMHIQGRAFDITYSSIGGGSKGNLSRFAQFAVKNGFVGFGLYKSFIHIDTGKGRTWGGADARWFIDAITQAGWYPGKPGLADVKTVNNSTTANSETESVLTGTHGGSGTLSNSELFDLMKSVGATDEEARTMAAIALAESSGVPTAHNDNYKQGGRDDSYGLWQINMLGNLGEQSRATFGLSSNSDLFDPVTNATVALALKRARGNYNDWSVYKSGAYEQFLSKDGAMTAANKGFRDPTGSLPYGGYKGKPSTHYAARGMNANMYQPEHENAYSARLAGFPVAGDKGTFGEPDIGEAPQYPYNITYGGLSGHLIEYDDTPGAERINIQHRSGSRWVAGASGTVVYKAVGNAYRMDGADSYHAVLGDYKLTAKDDIDIRSTADITMHSDGSLTLVIRNDDVEHVSGKKDVLVAEVLQIKAKRIIMETDNFDITVHENMSVEVGGDYKLRVGGNRTESVEGEQKVGVKGNMATSTDSNYTLSVDKDHKQSSKGAHDIHTEGAMNLRAKGAMGIDSSTSSIKVRAKTDMDVSTATKPAVVLRPNGLPGAPLLPEEPSSAAKVERLPEHTAKSTDLGKTPARAKVKKGKYRRKHPDTATTMAEALGNYGPNDPTGKA